MGRSFADTDRELSLDDFSRLLKEDEIFESNFAGKKGRYRVEAVQQGIFNGSSVLVDRTYLSCLAFVTVNSERNMPKLDAPKNEVRNEMQPYNFENRFPFWVTENFLMFTGAANARRFLLPFLEQKTGLKLELPEYDVERIYDDYKERGSASICGFGFMDRPEAIGSGSLYGDIDMTDPLIVELDGSEKNFVCLRLNINRMKVSVNIYKSGTLVIKKNWVEMQNYLGKISEIRERFREYEVYGSR